MIYMRHGVLLCLVCLLVPPTVRPSRCPPHGRVEHAHSNCPKPYITLCLSLDAHKHATFGPVHTPTFDNSSGPSRPTHSRCRSVRISCRPCENSAGWIPARRLGG